MNSSNVGAVLIDANILMNFAVVDGLDLLAERYGYRAVWTATVRSEVRRGVRAEPRLQRVMDVTWLGAPIEIEGVEALARVEHHRATIGGRTTSALHNLGEAEIMYLMETTHQDAILLTEDAAARDLAQRRGHRVLRTAEILNECYVMGEIGCPEAYELLKQMADEDRGVKIPSHAEVC